MKQLLLSIAILLIIGPRMGQVKAQGQVITASDVVTPRITLSGSPMTGMYMDSIGIFAGVSTIMPSLYVVGSIKYWIRQNPFLFSYRSDTGVFTTSWYDWDTSKRNVWKVISGMGGGSGSVTSITAGTGLSGGTITTSGTISMPSTGTPGTYDVVSSDAQGRITSGYSLAPNAVTRPINSSTWTISSTKSADAIYYASISCTATIGSASSGTLEFQYSTNGGTTWVPYGKIGNSNTVALAIVLNSVQVSTLPIVVSKVPANALCRLVSTIVGTTTITYNSGTETY